MMRAAVLLFLNAWTLSPPGLFLHTGSQLSICSSLSWLYASTVLHQWDFPSTRQLILWVTAQWRWLVQHIFISPRPLSCRLCSFVIRVSSDTGFKKQRCVWKCQVCTAGELLDWAGFGEHSSSDRTSRTQAIITSKRPEINTIFVLFFFPFVYAFLGSSYPPGGQILSVHAAGQTGARPHQGQESHRTQLRLLRA